MSTAIRPVNAVEKSNRVSGERVAAPGIRVLLVDQMPAVRASLRLLLEGQPYLSVIGDTGTKQEAVGLAVKEQPHLVLLSMNLGETQGLDLLAELQNVAPNTRVLVLAGNNDASIYQQALAHGAMGVIRKDQIAGILLSSLERANTSAFWRMLVPWAAIEEEVAENPEAERIMALTEREREVVTLVGHALKNQEIADRLFISETTVRHHLTSVFSKLGVTSRLGLIVYAYQHGLIKPTSPQRYLEPRA